MRRAYWIVWAVAAWGATPKEEPVGLMLLPGGAKLVRAGVETPLAARPGDVLFSGDSLRTEAGAASFLYCPGKSQQSLGPSGEVLLDAKALKVKTGKIADQKQIASCFLPQVVRVAAASQQHYGVSMTRGLKDAAEPTLEPIPPPVAQQLTDIDKALAADPKDQAALVARAAILEKNNLLANALADYRKVAAAWGEAVWVKGKIFELSEALANAAAQASAAPQEGAQTFALLIGVSKYQRLPQDQWLQFASADANMFEKHVRSPRGGSLPSENVMVLTDDKATTAAMRNAFQTFLKGRATKKDTVLILIAGHGTVEIPGSKGAFILTHDSDPQDLSGTALPMVEVQNLVQEELSKVGRVAVFVDVCRAGNIGSIKNTTVNAVVEKLGEAEGDILGIMASRPRELSFEGPQYGGGHGAFSYFLLKALNGAADKDSNGVVDINEVISFVQREVAANTNDKQHPREFGNFENTVPLSDIKKPGIDIAGAVFPVVYVAGASEPAYLAAAQATAGALSSETAQLLNRYADALAKGQITPDAPDSAFTALKPLKDKLPPEMYRIEENKLRVALEDRGQQVVLRYLTGDQVPQSKQDFTAGAAHYEAARLLTPESMFLDGREAFCKGRAMLFDKKYAGAADLLERAARIDPNGAHAYNALGIAYLEQADFARSIPAFRDAVKRAPHWAYPLHNLALAYVEAGDYSAAIRSYQQAIRLTPRYSYLPYNLGLVYQRINRRKDAETAYRKAMALAPDDGAPLNALGSLKASTGKAQEAEQLYKQALDKNPRLLEARHNLAILLAEKQERRSEAVALFRENLTRDPGYLPSRLSLAETLDDPKAAIVEYETILKARPEYVAARLAVAGLYEKSGDRDGAYAHLQEAARLEPRSAVIWERIGDLESARGNAAAAKTAYAKALELAPDSATKKRLRKK